MSFATVRLEDLDGRRFLVWTVPLALCPDSTRGCEFWIGPEYAVWLAWYEDGSTRVGRLAKEAIVAARESAASSKRRKLGGMTDEDFHSVRAWTDFCTYTRDSETGRTELWARLPVAPFSAGVEVS